MGRLEGKVMLISGGARGQGAEEARLFIREGAKVVIGDVSHGDGASLATALGPAALFTELDVTDETSWLAAVAATEQAFGRMDILVNNAGVLRRRQIEACSSDEFREVFEVNQLGVFLGMKTAVGLMKKTGGSMINISSTAGYRAVGGLAAYAGTKFAIRGLSKVAAIEFAPYGIRVNTVFPGLIDTGMIRRDMNDSDIAGFVGRQLIRRAGTPADVANLVLFLASDESSYVTGAEFVCDGGVLTGYA